MKKMNSYILMLNAATLFIEYMDHRNLSEMKNAIVFGLKKKTKITFQNQYQKESKK